MRFGGLFKTWNYPKYSISIKPGRHNICWRASSRLTRAVRYWAIAERPGIWVGIGFSGQLRQLRLSLSFDLYRLYNLFWKKTHMLRLATHWSHEPATIIWHFSSFAIIFEINKRILESCQHLVKKRKLSESGLLKWWANDVFHRSWCWTSLKMSPYWWNWKLFKFVVNLNEQITLPS